jgi:hypothetical protein
MSQITWSTSSAILAVPVSGAEVYVTGERVSWDHAQHPAQNQWFNETLRKKDTFNKKFVNRLIVKLDCKGGKGGGGAIIVCTDFGHIALGWPQLDMKSNGEISRCNTRI